MASSDMLKAAEAEVERLEAELAATEAFQKLQLARQVVELYRRIPSLKVKVSGRQIGPAEIVERMETKTARIEAAASKYLMAKGGRAPASELLPVMARSGIEIGGKEPVKALSAYLSTSKAFNNSRELGGYGLVEWGNSSGPDLLTKTGA